MGATTLKLKKQLHYRKTLARDRKVGGMYCERCTHYVPRFQVMSLPVFGCGGSTALGIEPRCEVMGLKHSMRYRIRPDYVCDAWRGEVAR